MNTESIQQLLERAGWIPRDGVLKIDLLDGGITNGNYRVETDAGVYVLRVAGENTAHLGINRHHEEHNQRVAARLGIAPEVVGFLESEGVFLTRFIDGRKPKPEQLRVPAILQAVVYSLRSLHGGPAFLGNFCPFATVDSYLQVASRHRVALPRDLPHLDCLRAEIHRALYSDRPLAAGPIHSDLLNDNLLLSGDRLWILDWEYSGMGDTFFDLANLADHHDFGEEDEIRLLQTYFGTFAEGDHARLKLMRIMSNAREAMWGVAQSALSHLDFDFPAYARRFAGRLAALARDPRYPGWLKAAGKGCSAR